MEHEEKKEPEKKRDGVRRSMIMDRWEMILETWACGET